MDRAPKDQSNEENPIIPLEMVGAGSLAAHTEWILSAVQRLQLQMDARNAFLNYMKPWKGSVSSKIKSLSHSVEKVSGRLYGVAVCETGACLNQEEIQELKNYCRNQYDIGRQDGYAHCPRQSPYKGLYIHYWQESGDRLLTRSELDAALESGLVATRSVVLGIDKDSFWTMIGEAKRLCGQDMDSAARWLEDQLLMMGPQEAGKFDNIVYGYSALAYKYGLWAAASVMLEGCSDDGFMDFRSWLIYQGKETYLAALKDPDSLAGVPLYGGGCFESLAYIGSRACEKLTGSQADVLDRPAFEELKAELSKDIQYGSGIGYPYKWKDLVSYLPRLCARYVQPQELLELTRLDADMWNAASPEFKMPAPPPRKARKSKGSEVIPDERNHHHRH